MKINYIHKRINEATWKSHRPILTICTKNCFSHLLFFYLQSAKKFRVVTIFFCAEKEIFIQGLIGSVFVWQESSWRSCEMFVVDARKIQSNTERNRITFYSKCYEVYLVIHICSYLLILFSGRERHYLMPLGSEITTTTIS